VSRGETLGIALRHFFAEYWEIVVNLAETTPTHKLDKKASLFNVVGGNKFAMSPVDVATGLFPLSCTK
jgi:hypothetical protein